MKVATEMQARLESERSGRRQAEFWPIGVVVGAHGHTRPVFLVPGTESATRAGSSRAPAGWPPGATDSARQQQVGAVVGPAASDRAVVQFVDDAGVPALSSWQGLTTGTPAIVAHVVGAQVAEFTPGAVHGAVPDSERLGQRGQAPVTVQLESHGGRGTCATVTIRHPELGRVDIRVEVTGRAVGLSLQASPTARRALASAREGLEASLQAQGFSLTRWQIEATGQAAATTHPSRFQHLDLEV